MKKLLTIIAIVLFLAVIAQAQTSTALSYAEDYRWHGFQIYSDSYVHPGVSTTIRDVDISVIAHADDAEMDDFEYWDTFVSRKLPSIAGFNLSAGYNYLVMPNGVDLQEASITASIPGTISPRLTYAYIIPDLADTEGQLYVIGLDVALGVPDAVSAVLSADVTYNDGVNPFGPETVKDWTHATAGVVLNVPVSQRVALQPAVFYQYTMETEALKCEEDEVWYAVGVKYTF